MVGNDWLILAEIVLTFVLVLGFGFWQLRSLKKLKEERERNGGKD